MKGDHFFLLRQQICGGAQTLVDLDFHKAKDSLHLLAHLTDPSAQRGSKPSDNYVAENRFKCTPAQTTSSHWCRGDCWPNRGTGRKILNSADIFKPPAAITVHIVSSMAGTVAMLDFTHAEIAAIMHRPPPQGDVSIETVCCATCDSRCAGFMKMGPILVFSAFDLYEDYIT